MELYNNLIMISMINKNKLGKLNNIIAKILAKLIISISNL
jgi:hypothetical protein